MEKRSLLKQTALFLMDLSKLSCVWRCFLCHELGFNKGAGFASIAAVLHIPSTLTANGAFWQFGYFDRELCNLIERIQNRTFFTIPILTAFGGTFIGKPKSLGHRSARFRGSQKMFVYGQLLLQIG